MQNLNLCTRSLFHWGQLEIVNKTNLPIERCATKDGVLRVLPKFSSLILSTVFSWMITLLFIVFLLQLILSSIKFRTSIELSSELSFAFFSTGTVVHWVAWKLPRYMSNTFFMGRKATVAENILFETVISISASVRTEPVTWSQHWAVSPLSQRDGDGFGQGSKQYLETRAFSCYPWNHVPYFLLFCFSTEITPLWFPCLCVLIELPTSESWGILGGKGSVV